MAVCKFNIGDMVKRINHNNGGEYGFKVGEVGTVVSFDSYFVNVKVNGKVNTGNDPVNLELVDNETFKFKIGDKVKVVAPAHGFKKHHLGKEVVIKSYNPNGKYTFNEPHYGVDGGTGFVWQESELELVTDEKIVITHNGKTTTATLYREDGSKTTATANCAPEDTFDFRVGAEIAMGRLVDKLVFASFNVIRVKFRESERSYSYKTRMQTAKVGMKIVVPVGVYGNKCNATVIEIIPGAEYNGEYAMSAMKEIDIVEVPQYYNGKVVCIKSGTDHWTVGKVYEVKDGIVYSDKGWMHPRSGEPYKDVNDIRHIGGTPLDGDWRHNPENEFIPIVE